MKYGFLSLCNTILVCLFFGYCQDSHSVPSGVFCSVGMCFPGLHRLAGLPSAEGWADTPGPGSTFVTGWKAGRHKASLLLWMNWATCWYPGVELGLGLPGRSLPGFFPLSCPLAEKANFFFLSSYLTPPFFLFLPISVSFILFPSLSLLLVVLGCRPFHVSVGCGRWKESPGKSPHCCSSNPEFLYSTHFLSIFQSPFIIVFLINS